MVGGVGRDEGAAALPDGGLEAGAVSSVVILGRNDGTEEGCSGFCGSALRPAMRQPHSTSRLMWREMASA